VVVLETGNVYTHVKFEPGTGNVKARELITLLRDNLKYENDFWSRQTNKHVKKYTSLVTANGRFATGLVGFVTGLLKQASIPYQIVDKQTKVPMPTAEEIVQRMGSMVYTPREYQEDAIYEGLLNRHGMFDMATGAGKSIIMAGLIGIWDLKTLVVVDSVDLARQLREDMEHILDEPVGLVGSGQFRPERVTVGIVSTLTRGGGKKAKKIKEFCAGIEHLIFDEVHHAQAATWQKVSKMCTGAPVRHGMSGTCFTSEVVLENGQRVSNRDAVLVGHTGPVVYKIRAKELIDMGYLSRPKVYMIQNTVYEDNVKLNHAEEYARIIMRDEERNRIAAEIAAETARNGGQTIVFVDRLDHGDILVELLTGEQGISEEDVAFVSGQDDKRKRAETIAEFKGGDLPIIIGTVLGEGLNFFPTVGINLAGGQSKKNVIQKIGRVLRKPPNPRTGDVDTDVENTVTFYDFVDSGHRWFEKHGKARLDTYMEQEFEVEVVQFMRGQMLESTMEKLDISGDNLKLIYSSFEHPYKQLVGKWEWKKGYKPRVKQLFVTMTEQMNIRTQDRFDEAIDSFIEYVEQGTKQWLGWDKATPLNYLGFLANKSSVELFAATKVLGNDLDIAGTETNDTWEF
jgi:superfamily II DNA or RNA helicase